MPASSRAAPMASTASDHSDRPDPRENSVSPMPMTAASRRPVIGPEPPSYDALRAELVELLGIEPEAAEDLLVVLAHLGSDPADTTWRARQPELHVGHP